MQDYLHTPHSKQQISWSIGMLFLVFQPSDCLFVSRATHVPVGEDQTQHLELTRDLAESLNRILKSESPLFPIPTLVDSAPS